MPINSILSNSDRIKMKTNTLQCTTPVAILLAAYNADKYLGVQIDSIIAQTSHDWTLYIRNDGSIDGTQQIIDYYTKRYPDRIVQIDIGGENLGCNKNFYRLLEVVEAEYYMFCDADDCWVDSRISLMLNKIRQKENIMPDIPILIQADSFICDDSLSIIHKSLWAYENLTEKALTNHNSILINCTTGGASSILNHHCKSVIFPIPECKRLMYDHWIGIQVSKNGVIGTLSVPLKYYRQHAGQECGISHKRSVTQRILNLSKTIRQTFDNANMLSEIGYGHKIKYFINRIKYEIDGK